MVVFQEGGGVLREWCSDVALAGVIINEKILS